MTPAIPSHIGKYEIQQILGRGGMGIVYLGFDRHLGRQVAIKTLTEGFTQDPEMLKRFYREATKTGALMHPNIVIVYDLGEQDGFPYIVMEYVPGTPLDQIIRGKRQLSIISKLKVMEQVCLALGYAHRNDVIHRDVKPANVIVQPDDNAKLLDFGLAHHEVHDKDRRLTRAGNVVGTMQYMAPERWRGTPFDGRSDIFSAGAMLYELLSSRLPYDGESATLFQQILHEPPPPLGKYLTDYPVALDLIIHRALAKNPDDRQSTAEEMAAEIAAISEQLREEKGAELFRQAEEFIRGEDFVKAREVLSQVIQLDSKNLDARKLLASVQSSLAVRQRAAQAHQLKVQSESAAESKLYSQAISFLEQALELDPSDAEIQPKLALLRQKQRVAGEIESCLQKSDRARGMGRFDEARSLLQGALRLDRNDSRVKSALHTLTAQIDEDATQRKVKQILDSAQAELSAGRFTAAIALLTEALQAYPGHAEMVRFLQTARAAHEQELRRRLIEQIQNEAGMAVTVPQIAAALEKVENALLQMPNEPSLLKLKAQLDRQQRELQIRAKVDETVQRCYPLMESAPQQALALVQQQLRELPAEERLLILQSAIEERLAHLKLEAARASYMARAHEAIRSQRYREAVQVLESCVAEGIPSDEITDLLEFARHEARRQERSTLIETTIAKANALIGQGSYDHVISLLEPVLAQYDDPSLRIILEKARADRHSEQQRFSAVLAKVQQLAAFQQWGEALTFLEQQPAAMRENDAVQSAIRELNEANDREGRILQAVGVAYAALHRGDLPAAHQQTEAVRQAQDLSGIGMQAVSALGTNLSNRLDSRLTQVADRLVTQALSEAGSALEGSDPKRAAEILTAFSAAKDFATLEVRQNWHTLKKQAAKARLLSRVGIRTKSNPRLRE